MANIRMIEGIGEALALKLRQAGIRTAEGLLRAGATPGERKRLAERSGISETQILRYAKNADLFRIKGVAGEYAELLVAAGVDTVPELAQRNPHNLVAAMISANQERKLVRQVPTVGKVKSWVSQANELPRVIAH